MELSEKVLWVSTAHYAAASLWEKTEEGWVCVYSEPLIGWMAGTPGLEVRKRLEDMKADYQWCEVIRSVKYA